MNCDSGNGRCITQSGDNDDDSSVRHVKDDDGNPDNLVGVAGDRR